MRVLRVCVQVLLSCHRGDNMQWRGLLWHEKEREMLASLHSLVNILSYSLATFSFAAQEGYRWAERNYCSGRHLLW